MHTIAPPRPVERPHASHRSWAYILGSLPLVWWTLSILFSESPWIFLDTVNLAFHEAGHLVFRIGGSTLMFLGGTLGQLMVPILLGARFILKERKPFAGAVCFWWIGQNLVNISVYMADARSLVLPLVGGGDHDWNELFYRFGLLSESAVIRTSGLTRFAGVVIMLTGMAWCGYFMLPTGPRRRLNRELTSRMGWMALLLERGR